MTGDSPIWIYDLLLSLGTDDVDAGDSPIWIDVLLFSLGTDDAARILLFSSVFEDSIYLSSIRLKTDSSMLDLAKIQIEACIHKHISYHDLVSNIASQVLFLLQQKARITIQVMSSSDTNEKRENEGIGILHGVVVYAISLVAIYEGEDADDGMLILNLYVMKARRNSYRI